MTQNEKQFLNIIISKEKEVYYNSHSNYGVFACNIATPTEDSKKVKKNDYGNITVKGVMPNLEFGKQYMAYVAPKMDKKYGLGYEIVHIYEQAPSTQEGQRIFLQALLTERQVENIFTIYPNEDVVAMIRNNTFDYKKVKGIGEVVYEQIKNKVEENYDLREAIVELSSKYGLTNKMIQKLSHHYHSPTLLLQKIRENPYVLANEVNGIGFKRADEIALKQGIKKDSPFRMNACIKYFLQEEANKGHSYALFENASGHVGSLLGVPSGTVLAYLKKLEEEKDEEKAEDLYLENNKVALIRNYRAEQAIASHISRLLSYNTEIHVPSIETRIAEIEAEQEFEFTEEQKQAIVTVVKESVVIVDGKAGTGKTSVLRGMIKILKSMNLAYHTCALSGKASQRIKESTGFQSSTIHKLLGFKKDGKPDFDFHIPLPYDLIVLDEASMVNAHLMLHLIRAIPNGAKFIILGDASQLEPIGVGNCFYDFIDSGVIPRVELTQVHRQAMKSGILSSANSVRVGMSFAESDNYTKRKLGELKDLHFYPYRKGDTVFKCVLELAQKYAKENLDIMDFQVIVPLKSRGQLCTQRLNKELQNIFNPATDSIALQRGDVTFRVKDKIISNGNNYEKGILNGSVGTVISIDMTAYTLEVQYDSSTIVEYSKSELKEIDLSYALTVHRTQGSQYKYVVVAFDYASYIMLSRQLVYTALTRAMKHCYLICELQALEQAIRTDKSTKRLTFLTEALHEVMKVEI